MEKRHTPSVAFRNVRAWSDVTYCTSGAYLGLATVWQDNYSGLRIGYKGSGFSFKGVGNRAK